MSPSFLSLCFLSQAVCVEVVWWHRELGWGSASSAGLPGCLLGCCLPLPHQGCQVLRKSKSEFFFSAVSLHVYPKQMDLSASDMAHPITSKFPLPPLPASPKEAVIIQSIQGSSNIPLSLEWWGYNLPLYFSREKLDCRYDSSVFIINIRLLIEWLWYRITVHNKLLAFVVVLQSVLNTFNTKEFSLQCC